MDATWVDIPMSVSVQSTRFSRGIYLRQPYETSVSGTFKVEIKPLYNKAVTSDFQFNFEIRLKIVSSAAWISCNDNAVLHSNGKVISILVDPSSLSPGLYCEFVRVYDENRPDLGPICSIPVTVTKPVVIPKGTSEYNIGVLSFEPGCVERRFIVPPQGCQYIDAVIKDTRDADGTSGDASPSTLVLHALQLYKGTPYRDNEKDVSISPLLFSYYIMYMYIR
jgi:hypothetical protein